MKVSHVLYKVNDLQRAVVKFQNMGFKVEFGSKHKPHNALIYFSEGPYIELLSRAPVSWPINLILKFSGKGKVVKRFNHWRNVKEGFFGLCLENYRINFNQEKAILSKHNQEYFITKSSRIDPLNRTLKWNLLFPYELKLPFLMTYFNTNPKPKNFIHPNGIKKIKSISFGTDDSLCPVIKDLCDDKILKLTRGNGIESVTYEKIEANLKQR